MKFTEFADHVECSLGTDETVEWTWNLPMRAALWTAAHAEAKAVGKPLVIRDETRGVVLDHRKRKRTP